METPISNKIKFNLQNVFIRLPKVDKLRINYCTMETRAEFESYTSSVTERYGQSSTSSIATSMQF